MKDLFPGYYKPSAETLRDMWGRGVICVDTNVLLDVFRVSDDTARQLLDTLERLSQRLWLPHHVAQEYHSHVDAIVAEQVKPYDEAGKRIEGLLESLASPRSHPFVDDALLNEARDFFKRLNAGLAQRRERIEGLLSDNALKERISKLFSGKVGDKLSNEETERICREGADRFDRKIPPGYADKKDKPEPQRYGDLIIWESLIVKLANEKRPGIFVTSDVKEDWFLRVSGKTIGPRPELVSEVKARAGVDFYLYATPGFLGYANEYLNAGVRPEAIREVQALEADRRAKTSHMGMLHTVRRMILHALGPEAKPMSYARLGGGKWQVRLADGRRVVVNPNNPISPVTLLQQWGANPTKPPVVVETAKAAEADTEVGDNVGAEGAESSLSE